MQDSIDIWPIIVAGAVLWLIMMIVNYIRVAAQQDRKPEVRTQQTAEEAAGARDMLVLYGIVAFFMLCGVAWFLYEYYGGGTR